MLRLSPMQRHAQMERSHATVVEAQFGPRAKAYVDSSVHARGADLEALEAIVVAAGPRHAIDLGCGGGHVSYLMARHAGAVTAVDLSSEMLAAVAASAQERGLANIATRQSPVEHLPFPAGSFDFLACRYTAHHWHDFEAGLREGHRVVKPGAPAIFIDAVAPDWALLDTHLQAVELLRDGSHVRDYTVPEWLAALARSGFTATGIRTWRLRLDFASWVARIGTPEADAATIRRLQESAPAEIRSHYAIEPDGSFMLDVAMLETVAR